MNTIKHIIIKRYKVLSLIALATFCSLGLLTARIKFTHSFYFLFLVWNLFLAIIPYVISTYLTSKPQINKLALVFWSCVWLLFLPNAPYIITDLFHLRLSKPHLIWLDVLVISSFALTGLFLFYLSILELTALFKKRFKKIPNFAFYSVFFLSSFGMYLGRFLRYNSWEIINRPQRIFNDIFNMIIKPSEHYSTWQFTIGFGCFLSLGYWIFKRLLYLKHKA